MEGACRHVRGRKLAIAARVKLVVVGVGMTVPELVVTGAGKARVELT
jgi:hypothetical protein